MAIYSEKAVTIKELIQRIKRGERFRVVEPQPFAITDPDDIALAVQEVRRELQVVNRHLESLRRFLEKEQTK